MFIAGLTPEAAFPDRTGLDPAWMEGLVLCFSSAHFFFAVSPVL